MLQIQNLHVSIGDREVLKGINLNIDEGETFILFGPNGSGKTTLLIPVIFRGSSGDITPPVVSPVAGRVLLIIR